MRYLTLRETAERCRVSVGTARYWVKSGKLPLHQPGKYILVPESAVEQFLADGHTVQDPVEAVVAAWPSLTVEQVERLRALLPPVGA